MTFDPTKFLVLCRDLFRGAPCRDLETLTRTIICRAYYSAFLHSREYLKEKEDVVFTNSGEDHVIVEVELKRRVSRTLGSVIRDLREERQLADYCLYNPVAFSTQSGAWRLLYFDQNAQQESIRLAEFVVVNLPRT